MPTVLETLREGRPPLVTLKAATEEVAWLVDKADAVLKTAQAEKRELSADETAIFDAASAEAGRIKSEVIPRFEAHEKNRAGLHHAAPASQAVPYVVNQATEERPRISFSTPIVPEGYASEEQAYRAGMWAIANLYKRVNPESAAHAARWCKDHGVGTIQNVMKTTDPSTGGALVPQEFSTAIIRLVEDYGVFRREARRWPMGSDTSIVPKATGRLTTYFVAEGNAPTASDTTSKPLTLTARDLATITRISNNLTEDAAVSVAGILAQEIGYAFALKEDQCGWLGDGTSTYGGIVGVTSAVDATYSTKTTDTGHDTWEEYTIADFLLAVSALPQWSGIRPKWYIHSVGYFRAMVRLMQASGGTTWEQTANGQMTPMFLGYPVVFSQVLPSAGTTGTTVCFFGDLGLAAYFGDRKGLTVSESEHFYFSTRELAVLAEERFDINIVSRINDAGDGAGAIVRLKAV